MWDMCGNLCGRCGKVWLQACMRCALLQASSVQWCSGMRRSKCGGQVRHTRRVCPWAEFHARALMPFLQYSPLGEGRRASPLLMRALWIGERCTVSTEGGGAEGATPAGYAFRMGEQCAEGGGVRWCTHLRHLSGIENWDGCVCGARIGVGGRWRVKAALGGWEGRAWVGWVLS